MMNVVFVVLANRALSNVIEDANSKTFRSLRLRDQDPLSSALLISLTYSLYHV